MRAKFLCAVTILSLVLSAPAGGLAFTFTTIDVPGAGLTRAFGINDAGQIVGYFCNASCRGFLKDGATFTTIDAGASITQAYGINNAGQIVGEFFDGVGGYHGFVTEAAVLEVAVAIDIKPGSFPNSINLKSKGVVTVAVLGSADFSVHDVDLTTIVFAGASPARCSFEDVNLDGHVDLVCHFRTQDLNLTTSSTQATLTGETTGGTPITGTDSVRIVK